MMIQKCSNTKVDSWFDKIYWNLKTTVRINPDSLVKQLHPTS